MNSVDIKFENFVNILKINSYFVNICPSEFSNLTLLSRQQQSFRKFVLLQFKHVENKWMNENNFFLQVFLMSRFLCHIMSSAKQKICKIKDVGSNNYHKYYLVSTIQRHGNTFIISMFGLTWRNLHLRILLTCNT